MEFLLVVALVVVIVFYRRRSGQIDVGTMVRRLVEYGFLLGLGVIIAIAVLFNTLLMNLAERDSELATLRVLGAPIRRIGTMMLGEHFAIGLIGGILACIFTIVATRHLISAMVQWSFYFSVQADPAAAATLIGVIVFISVALTPFGMWRVSRMDLVERVKDLSQ